MHELTSASRVIFMGYSFPIADQDMRYLLRRALVSQADVKVILAAGDDPSGVDQRLRSLLAASRYNAFFRLNAEAISFGGWEESLQQGWFD